MEHQLRVCHKLSHLILTTALWDQSHFFFFSFFMAAGAAYGSSQARGWVWAAAVGLHHSDSDARSRLHLQPKPQLWQPPGPYPLSQPGIEPTTSWILVRFVTLCATIGTLIQLLLPFYRWRNRGSQRLRKLPKDTQLVSRWVGIWSLDVCSPPWVISEWHLRSRLHPSLWTHEFPT